MSDKKKLKSVHDIKPYPNNAKLHPDEQLEALAKAVDLVGWQQPIVVDEDNIILAGHGRLLTYQKYGDQYDLPIPWVTREDGVLLLGKQNDKKLTPEERKMWRLADNKLNESAWDFDTIDMELSDLSMEMQKLAGFEDWDKLENMQSPENTEIDTDEMEEDMEHECPRCGFNF